MSDKPIALLSCPFCEGMPKLLQREHPAIKHVPLAWVVQCDGCTAETCSEHRQWAIDYWNRRSSIPRAQIEALEDEMRTDQEPHSRKYWADRLSALLHPELKGEDK